MFPLAVGTPDMFHSESNPPGPNNPCLHDIKIKFHPNGHRSDQYIPHNSYHSGPSATAAAIPDPPVLDTPWHPFHSRLDFEVAEFALSSHLNKSETETLLSIIRRYRCKLPSHLRFLLLVK